MQKLTYYLCILVFILHCKSETDVLGPEILANKGWMDLSAWNIDEKQSIELKGDWEFYPFQILTYGEFPETTSLLQKVPLVWNGNLPNKTNANGVGYGTLRLRLKSLPKQKLMLYITSIPTSNEIYCGPVLISSSGKVATKIKDAIPNLSNSIGSIPESCSSYNEIIWHISNFHEFKGGPWIAPLIGKPNAIIREYSNHLAQDLFFLGVTLIMCVYHFVLWFFRRQDRRSLVFSIVCFLFMVRILGTGKTIEFYFPSANLYELFNKLEYIGFIGLLVSFPWLCRILFPLEISRYYIWINTFLGGIFFIQTLLFPALVYTSYLTYLQLITLASIIIISYGIIKAFYWDRPGARIMIVGYLFLILTILHDLFISHRLIYGIHIAPIGFFVFLVSQSSILARIFSNAFRTAEHLTLNLKSEVEAKTTALQIADEQKSSFFANISHELRTPLTLILWPIEASISSKKQLTEKQINIIYNNAKKLLSLVNQLLDLQKIAAGKFQLQLKSLDISKMTEEILENFSYAIEHKKIKLEFSNKVESAIVLADPSQIEKCISNYLSNAMKFTPEDGSIKILIQNAAQSNYLQILIQDTGRGIPENKKQFLFKRFGYSEPSLTKEQEGTGLGLSLVREIIELHNGEVGFNSEEGVGSEFWFTLPLSNLSASSYNLSQNFNHLSTTVKENKEELNLAPVQSGAKVLVVEDNEDLREFISGILESKGFTTYKAIDGEDGLAKIYSILPDIILTDLMMPKLSGSDMIRLFKKNQLTKTIPVILLTAKAEVETRKEVRLAGADAYLSKPFNSDELLAVVKNLLQLKQMEKHLLIEMGKAQKIQEALLPKFNKKYKEFDCELFLKSYDKIGGDFYDIIEINPKLIRFIIADVSGHGLPSALIASTLKILFQKSKNLSITEFLNSANHDLYGNLGGHFITSQVIELDLESSTLSLASAGHPGIYHMRNKSIQIIESRGRALGITENAEYKFISLPLQKGDRIFMVTDGLIEVKDNSNGLLGEDGLKEILMINSKQSIQEAVHSIIDNIISFSNEKDFSDDATMIVLDWKN